MNDKNKTLSLETSLNKADLLKGEEDEHEHGEHEEHGETKSMSIIMVNMILMFG